MSIEAEMRDLESKIEELKKFSKEQKIDYYTELKF